MGGDGSGKRKGDAYTHKLGAKRSGLKNAMEDWFMKHPGRPYPMRRVHKETGQVFIEEIWEYPNFGNQKKDGTPRRKWKRRGKTEALIATDEELKQAVEYIRELEEAIEQRALHSSPEGKAKLAERRREYQRKRYRESVQAERKLLLPEDQICILCDVEQHTSKQWVVCDFLDGKHAICKSCFTKLRLEMFLGKSDVLRAYLKTIKYTSVHDVKSK